MYTATYIYLIIKQKRKRKDKRRIVAESLSFPLAFEREGERTTHCIPLS